MLLRSVRARAALALLPLLAAAACKDQTPTLTGDPFFPPDLEQDDPESTARSAGVISSPSSEDHPLRVFYFLTFLAARERLWITTPYLVPDRQIRAVLKNRARAGIDVRVLVPGEHTDAWPIRRASHSYYRELLDAGWKRRVVKCEVMRE